MHVKCMDMAAAQCTQRLVRALEILAYMYLIGFVKKL